MRLGDKALQGSLGSPGVTHSTVLQAVQLGEMGDVGYMGAWAAFLPREGLLVHPRTCFNWY